MHMICLGQWVFKSTSISLIVTCEDMNSLAMWRYKVCSIRK